MKKQIIIGCSCIILSLVLGYAPFSQYIQERRTVAMPGFITSQVGYVPAGPMSRTEGKPLRVIIAKLGLSVQIKDGIYNELNKSWTLSDYAAHYAISTPKVNNLAGNTFIYGHNNPAVFSSLYKLQPGDELHVVTDTEKTFVYLYTGSYVTSPEDTSPLTYQGPPIVTLQTCSGIWFENRQLFTFEFQEVI